MDAFQAALDALTKESKEQITLVLEAAAAAVLTAHIVPQRLAVLVAQRFTPERVETAYPVLCLLDAALVRTASTGSASSLSVFDQALAAVLTAFWEVAPGVMTTVHDYGVTQPAWREKSLRLVRRWKQRRLLADSVVDAVLLAMEKGAVVADTAQESATSGSGGAGNNAATSSSNEETVQRTGTASASPSAPSSSSAAPPTPTALAFTAVQARAFAATLQACMSTLEALPAPRRALFLELLHHQHFRTPTRTAMTFYEDLLADLRREVTSSTAAATAAGGEAHPRAGDAADAAAAGHAREALGKLLDQLHTGGPEDDHGGRGRAGAAPTAATTVVRYTSPLFLDLYAKQPLCQRGSGFGVLQRKAEHGSSNNAFYTSYYPKPVTNAQRPFRVPAARQMHGGAVRLWFPRPEEWVATQDMADLAQYASRNAAGKERKRGREGEEVETQQQL